MDRDRTDDAGQHFLVADEHAAESIEAAWKYIIVVSGGISLALLGTVLFYWAGSLVLGPTYDMTWAALAHAAPRMNRSLLILAFLLVLIGYGTKVGLAPMHTWLPDAHSEGPTPVSALLSGALLNTAMIGIIRYLAVADAADVGVLPRMTLVALGVFHCGRHAVYRAPGRCQAPDGLFQRRAYGRDRAWRRLWRAARPRWRSLSHAEPLAEQVADVLRRRSMMRSYETKSISAIRLVGRRFPVTGGSGWPVRSPSPAHRLSACSPAN